MKYSRRLRQPKQERPLRIDDETGLRPANGCDARLGTKRIHQLAVDFIDDQNSGANDRPSNGTRGRKRQQTKPRSDADPVNA